MERKKYGFTMIELLTVIGIIALLVGLLIPALNMVNTMAKEAKQKAQITAIELALTAFRNDYGDYPRSDSRDVLNNQYCGAQRLAEALLGWDLMGFHPKSAWTSYGVDKTGTIPIYPFPLDPSDPLHIKNLEDRRGPYLELGSTNAFKLHHLYNVALVNTAQLNPETYVICDVFGRKRVVLAPGQIVNAGTPILYYRADTSRKTMQPNPPEDQIYKSIDNMSLLSIGKLPKPDPADPHKLFNDPVYGRALFYNRDYKIIDPKITSILWPHRPDSYILISAGADGEYGTADDITNF